MSLSFWQPNRRISRALETIGATGTVPKLVWFRSPERIAAMEKELLDRVESVQERIVQLRDSL